jgi:peptide/histidine transporter 3/4
MIAQLINGTSYLTVLLGGYLADAVLGRNKTVLFAAGLNALGLMLLTVSAGVAETMSSHTVDIAVFLAAEGCIALAFGGIKPNVSPLGADQFDDFDADGRALNDKERFFGWYYFFINVGALLAATLLVWVQTSISWTLGFALPTAISLIALAAFVAGWRGYRVIPPGDNPLRRITQVIALAVRKRHLAIPDDPLDLYEQDLDSEDVDGADDEPPPLMHTDTMRWLDRAAVVPPGASWPLLHEPPPKDFVRVTQVEETKQMARLIPVLLAFLVWNLCYAQLGTIMVQQAESMNRVLGGRFEMPAASVTIFSTLTILVLVPLWDRLLRPSHILVRTTRACPARWRPPSLCCPPPWAPPPLATMAPPLRRRRRAGNGMPRSSPAAAAGARAASTRSRVERAASWHVCHVG